jgi:hypothetical protein
LPSPASRGARNSLIPLASDSTTHGNPTS